MATRPPLTATRPGGALPALLLLLAAAACAADATAAEPGRSPEPAAVPPVTAPLGPETETGISPLDPARPDAAPKAVPGPERADDGGSTPSSSPVDPAVPPEDPAVSPEGPVAPPGSETAPTEGAPEVAAPPETRPAETSPADAAPAHAPPADAAPASPMGTLTATSQPDAGYFTTDPARAPWRGTGLSLRNAVTVTSFDKSSDLTYNPTVTLELDARLRWWLFDRLYAQLALGVGHELTESDSNTFARESVLSDTTLRVAAPALVTIPVAELAISPALSLRFPTSKASQGASLQAALTMELALSRAFDVLDGLHLAYQFQATHSFHRFTTGTLESPRIQGCVSVGGVCSSLLNTGVRNSDWRLTHIASVDLSFLPWLGMSTQVGWISDHVRPGADDPRVSYVAQLPTDWRHYLLFGVEVALNPLPGLQVAAGASTSNAQLAPDSSRYTPLFNRHTAVYVDLRVDVAPIIDALMAQPEGPAGTERTSTERTSTEPTEPDAEETL